MKNDNVLVKKFSIGELPGDVQLLTEVDLDVGPFPPAPESHGEENYDNNAGSGA